VKCLVRNVMSVLFNHTIRHGIGSLNPIRLVRQSAKRKKIPLVLTPDEIRKLIAALPLKESTLVLLDVGTGLRMSELFGLKWGDVRFETLADPARAWSIREESEPGGGRRVPPNLRQLLHQRELRDSLSTRRPAF